MKTKNKKQGTALLTVLGIISIVIIISTMLAYTCQQQTRSSLITRDMLKARMIAESGLNKAYHAIKSDFSKTKNYTTPISENFDTGSYTVQCRTFSDDKANRAQLTATGVCGLGSVIVGADLENIPLSDGSGGDDSNYFALDYSMFINGTLFGRGNGNYTLDSIHSNNDMTFKGSTDFYKPLDLSSSESIDLGKKQSGDVGSLTENAPHVTIPQVPVESFIAVAEANGQIYSSVNDLPANPPGGVAVCTATSAKWNNIAAQTGCYIFLGSFQISSGLNLNADPATGYPALIVMGTSVHISGSGNKDWHHINGAVYAPNASMHITGGTIRGPVVCGQDLDYSGTGNVFDGGSIQGFNLPPPEETTIDNVIITAWY